MCRKVPETVPEAQREARATPRLPCSCLARPNGIAQTAAFLLWIAACRSNPARKAAVALFLGGALVVLTPWAVRNCQITGIPSPLTFFAPYNMWLGMNEQMYQMYRAGDTPAFKDHAGLLASIPFVFHLRFRFPVLDPYAVLLASHTLYLFGRIMRCTHPRDARETSVTGSPHN